MEYHLHETAPKSNLWRRNTWLRSNWKVIGLGIFAGLVLWALCFVVFRGHLGRDGVLGLAIPRPTGQTVGNRAGTSVSGRNVPIFSPVTQQKKGTGPISSTRKPEADVGVWRNPFFDDFFVSDPYFGRPRNDILDLFDSMTQFQDMEDYLLARRRVRQAYEEELERLSQQRRLPKDNFQEERMMEDSQSPIRKKDIVIDRPFGLSTFGKSWNVPSLESAHTDNTYQYILDIEGMDRENLKLSLQDNIMMIEGKKMVETENGYHSSSFKRSFSLPADAELDSLRSQELADGKLMITAIRHIPEAPVPPSREIEIQRLSREEEALGKNKNHPLDTETKNVDGTVSELPPVDGTVSDLPPEPSGK
mmetsp:Transcript_20095/g.28012  ORF Transcript_20095/g.28012 Transcript_20095/m.28012 type:complete len:362 (+) Transcript_20095:80-1165(+)|eukprot:CAMPEP_0184490986 /NCGR_PEP_ID=MMETSP0113_2-20130426/19357_1 /TAXON_ID=91329 /ORGANISM="Norrisiella sphaerica, Strain BC52" /LENGTH=361 /DNA_ID=CAMNT_0026875145 /DNA_START=69 /DNA_END=1154 /DNA_ORIENTATION=-